MSDEPLNPNPKTPADWAERARIIGERHRKTRPELEAHIIVQAWRAGGGLEWRFLVSGQQHEQVIGDPKLRAAMLEALEAKLK